MLRTCVTTAAATLALTLATTASAQDARGFGQKGQIILSAERLAPLFSYSNNKVGSDPADSSANNSTSTTSVGLLANFNSVSQNGTFFNVPHVGFDYTIIDRLTLGGAIYVAFTPTSRTSSTVKGVTTSTDSDKSTFFGIAPRVGYILPLNDLIAFWPRGGFSFNYLNQSSPDRVNGNTTTSQSSTATLWALNLEPMFAISPVQHFAITLGPVIDIPLTGSAKTDVTTNGTTRSASVDYSQFHFGITAGLLGWF